MKLSAEAITTLKNFARVNQGIRITPGSSISTMTPIGTVLAQSNVDCEFDGEFCIYNLPTFLGILSLFNDPELIIKEYDMTITDGDRSVRYRFADPSNITYPKEEMLEKAARFDDCIVSFNMLHSDFNTLIKAANILGVPDIAFISENGYVYAECVKLKDVTSNNFKVKIAECGVPFTAVINKEYITLLPPADYTISLAARQSARGKARIVSRFAGQNHTYWIATEESSVI